MDTGHARLYLEVKMCSTFKELQSMSQKMLRAAITNTIPYSDQVIFIQLKANPTDIGIIHMYVPTADKLEYEQ